MTPEFQKLWAAALRSGKYKKGVGALRIQDEFCCLGVACDLIDPEGWHPPNLQYYRSSALGWKNLAPGAVRKLMPVIGLKESELRSLTIANDRGVNFEQIATLIEALPTS